MFINVEDLLSKTDRGLDVFKYYLGSRFERPNKAFKSPFYNDSKASCSIYYERKSNRYKYKDFGESDKAVDCIGFVSRLYSKGANGSFDFISTLKQIEQDLNLLLDNQGNTNRTEAPQQPKYETKPIPLEVSKDWKKSIQFQDFTSNELEYWKQYGIDLALLRNYNVKSVKSFHGISNSKKNYTINSDNNQPIFAYCFSNYVKLYRPFSKLRFLFIGQKTNTYIFGYELLPLRGNLLFITGGEKDVLSLAAHGLHAICFNSETASIPNSILTELNRRFNHIVLLYDCDKTGIEAMDALILEFKEQHLFRLILPLTGLKEDKDVSDFFKQGKLKEELLQLFHKELSRSYSNTMNILRTCEVNLKKTPKLQTPVLSILNSSIGSPGNLVGITGTEGSGKSNFISGAISGCLNPTKEVDTLGMVIQENRKSKAVIIYDTEQSEHQLHKNIDSVRRRALLNELPSWFKAYSLVSLNRKERLKTIIESMDNFYYEFKGIHLVVIDGIADLIGSVNDEEQSVDLVNKLFQLAGYYNTLIVCVLHMNPGGLKLRGHLGSELQRKASGVLSVDRRKDQENSNVKVLKLREANPIDVPIIQFSWDDTKQHHCFTGYINNSNSQKNKINNLREFAKEIFAEKSTISSIELNEFLMDYYEIKERMARNYIKIMRDNSIIKGENRSKSTYILVNNIKNEQNTYS